MRALLTGAGGFIGAHTLAHIMHNTDWELVCLDSFRHRGKTDRIREMLTAHPDWHARTKVFMHDLAAPLSDQLIEQIGPIDYILNVASESHVDRSIDYPVSFIRNNVELVMNMLEYARHVRPRVFMQISTDEVYGAAPPGHDHKEWSPILPSNPYSASKAAQEAIAISYWRTYNVPVVITNTMNNFGEMQDPEKYIPMLMKNIYNGQQVTIHGNAQKIGSRFYLHARNHADALLFIINNLGVAKYKDDDGIAMPDRYNVVGDVELDNLEVARYIHRFISMLGHSGSLRYELVDFHATRPGHDRRYALDGSKLKKLGWKPPVPFEESLRKTVEWTLAHKEWML